MNTGAIFLLLLLACPLLMMWMMRGGHGAHGTGGHAGHGCGHGGHGGAKADADTEPSLDELRRRRDELDRAIEARETSQRETMGAGSSQGNVG
jgi:hypothetical protein